MQETTLKSVDATTAATVAPRDTASAQSLVDVPNKPWLTIFSLLVTDLFTLAVVFLACVKLRHYLNPLLPVEVYYGLWPSLLLFPIAFAAVKVYPVVGFSPAEELRRLTSGTTIIYLIVGAMTFILQKESEQYSRVVFLLSWVLSLAAVPLARTSLRWLCGQRGWWGYPVVVMGAGRTGDMIVKSLLRNPGLGLRPVAVLDDDPAKHGKLCGVPPRVIAEDGTPPPPPSSWGVPIVGGLNLAPALARQSKIPYAILAMPGVPHQDLLKLIEEEGRYFPSLIVIPDLFGFASLQVPARDIGGVLGVEVRQQLVLPVPRLVKRSSDMLLTIIGGAVILPVLLLLALAVKLSSPGPVFYGHTRIGRNGRRFKAWKFRSMRQDADRVLKEYLEQHPELRTEWEQTHKLKNDPRVTAVGRFLRRTSLDELPQIWNVVLGEMSLVGPRPIVEEEIEKYSEKFAIYTKVRPGITGLWQVSGRNDTTYNERVELDTYYVRNWSLWLDVYILARTVRVVLYGSGAY